MRRSILVVAAFVAAAFAVGYLAGSVNGVVRGFAANSPQASATGTPTTRCTGIKPYGPHVAGTVSGISGTTITISPVASFRDEASVVTEILTNSSTEFYTAAGATASLSAVKNGDMVRAVGALSSDGKSLTATRVVIGTGAWLRPHYFGASGSPHPHAFGTVSGIKGNTIDVAPISRFGTMFSSVTSIVTTSSTVFYNDAGGTTSISSVKTGDYVIATGSLSADGKTLTATRVFAVSPGGLRGRFFHGWNRHGPGRFSGSSGGMSTTL